MHNYCVFSLYDEEVLTEDRARVLRRQIHRVYCDACRVKPAASDSKRHAEESGLVRLDIGDQHQEKRRPTEHHRLGKQF